MNILEISQTIFYFTVSFAIIAVGSLFAIAVFEIIIIARSIRNFLQNINNQSIELYKRVDGVLETLSGLPFISTLFKKKSRSKK